MDVNIDRAAQISRRVRRGNRRGRGAAAALARRMRDDEQHYCTDEEDVSHASHRTCFSLNIYLVAATRRPTSRLCDGTAYGYCDAFSSTIVITIAFFNVFVTRQPRSAMATSFRISSLSV